MGINQAAVSALQGQLVHQDRTYAWLSREAGVPYKRLLAEVKHATTPVTLETALAAGDALGLSLAEIVGRAPSIPLAEWAVAS